MVGIFTKGNKCQPTNKYKPLDIVSQKESGTNKEIDEIKEVNEKKLNLLLLLKHEMKKDKKSSYNSIIESIQIILKEIIKASESLKNNNYTDKDIRDMAEIIYSE